MAIRACLAGLVPATAGTGTRTHANTRTGATCTALCLAVRGCSRGCCCLDVTHGFLVSSPPSVRSLHSVAEFLVERAGVASSSRLHGLQLFVRMRQGIELPSGCIQLGLQIRARYSLLHEG